MPQKKYQKESSCASNGRCPKNRVCHPVDKRCYKRGDPRIADVMDVLVDLEDAKAKQALWYPAKWKKRPGQRGFNEYVRKLIEKSNLKLKIGCDYKKPEPQSYQKLLQWIMSPDTKMHRLLVQWQLGAGKTIGMVTVLNNFYMDGRPKLIISPNKELVSNFYATLAWYPNLYKQWYERSQTKFPSNGSATQKSDWIDAFQHACSDLRSSLPSPMRAFTYSIAGGKTIEKDRIMFSRGRLKSSPTNFDNVVILCDEAHNMVKPGDKFTSQQKKLMHNTGKKIMKAQNAVVCLFTATPIIDSVENFVDLMRVVTGDPRLPLLVKREEIEVGGAEHTVDRLVLHPREDAEGLRKSGVGVLDGHISCFMQRPQEVFAQTKPLADDEMPEIVECPLIGSLLEKYVQSRFFKSGKLPKAPKVIQTHQAGKLYNLATKRWVVDNAKNRANEFCVEEKPPLPTKVTKQAALQCLVAEALFKDKSCKTTLQRYENTVSGARSGGVGVTNENMADTAAKLARIVEDLSGPYPRKTAILLHKSTGYEILVQLLKKSLPSETVLYIDPKKSSPMTKAQTKAAELVISKFNDVSNMRGEKHQLIVLPSENYSEGISLYGVRQIILPDISIDKKEPTWALLKQRIGRALRLCSHHKYKDGRLILGAAERTLNIKLYVATLPDASILKAAIPVLTDAQADQIAGAQTMDQAKLDIVRGQYVEFEDAQDFIRKNSIEYGMW